MRLTVLGSSSAANGYVLQNDTEALVLECGCPVNDCIRALGYNTQKVSGVLVTHEHGDHAKHIGKYLERFDVYCSQGTASAIHTSTPLLRPKVLQPFQAVNIGAFTVTPFPTEHDCAEPFGYQIDHPEIGRMVFATDTYFVRYTFDGMTNLMIECNYDQPILDENVRNGVIPAFLRRRTMRSHMSLQTCIEMLRANDLTNVSQIVLVHLSAQNSDAERFRREVSLAVGKRVVIAKKGLEIPFNRTPFEL